MMPLTRKLPLHYELFWWLVSLILATVLIVVLVREARGIHGDSLRVTSSVPPAFASR